MATFTAGTASPIRFDEFDVEDTFDPPGATYTTTPTVYQVTLPDGFDRLTGKFTYNKSGDLVGGTVATWTGSDDGQTTFLITGLNLSVAAASPFVNSGNSQGFLALAFAGNDFMDGSPFDDYMIGYAGNDQVRGRDGADTLDGGAGNDLLDGGAGADSMIGGAGNEAFVVDDLGDVVVEGKDGGADLVQSSVAFTLSEHIESLTLTGTGDIDGAGNALANVIIGNDGTNLLTGFAGNDKISAAIGNDTALGGLGNDTLTGDLGLDSLDGGDGNDSAVGGADSDALIGGAGNDTLIGDNGDDTLDGGTGTDAMTGGNGGDRYIVDSASDKVTETTDPGLDTVESSVNYTLGANLEDLVLTGAAALGTGNVLNNAITGNAADNTLDGGVGADKMAGGLGDDTYVVNDAGDQVSETGGDGTDTVKSSVTFALADPGLEHLLLSGTTAIDGTGNTLDNNIVGNTAANKLAGDAGNDTLDGHTGADSLTGGDGDDVYVVDNVGDQVTESGTGNDEIRSTLSVDLSKAGYENIENAKLTSSAAANLTGNALDNGLTGNSAANVIDGGLGEDVMTGGAGNDTYLVDSLNDKITELFNGGTDSVISDISLVLADNLENLTLRDVSGAFDATGNAAANKITGNKLANLLDGGLGADTLIGGDGDDTFVVDDAGDLVQDASPSADNDSVRASVSYTLVAGIENLTLEGAATKGTGNTLNNKLVGNDLNNLLNGLAGADQMFGGKGDDIYIVDNTFDTADETGGNGNDAVQSSASFTIAAGIETLLLTGTAAIDGFGNGEDNTITGNAGANRLTGNDGADTLTGGAGNDTLDGDEASVDFSDTLDGGSGADAMILGIGDTAIVDNIKDTIVGGGTGSTVRSSVSYSLMPLTTIEELHLTGAAAINGTGNNSGNRIVGNAAANILDGGVGADTLEGGDGNDTYIVNSSIDQVSEINPSKSGGIDLVKSSVDFVLGSTALENLTLTGTANIFGYGNAVANVITGNAGANDLIGWDGNDTLIGGDGNDTLAGADGIDSMAGGGGDDLYQVGSLGEKVTELSNGGKDKVQSWVTFSLGAYVENLDLAGTAIGGYGNGLNNHIRGTSGNNILDGNAGADTMDGGDGTDTYYVRELTDLVTENGAADIDDEVVSTVAIGLVDNVEHYTFKVTTALNFTGSDAHNRITGGSGADTLAGGLGDDTLDGGGGNDLLIGGVGNDVYVVGAAGDKVDESGGDLADIDEVWSAVTFNLTANGTTVLGDIENLTLTGSAAISGTGNDLANTIIGNGGANKLMGGLGNDSLAGNAGNDTLDGGAGNDTSAGGDGNDSYVVDSDADMVDEGGGSGIDTVLSAASGFDLSADTNGAVENLTLAAGAGNIAGFGNALNNLLTGNEGDNALTDVGGSDTLNGGAGNDTLMGGDGADKLDGGLDDDRLAGGAGDDTIVVSGGNDTVSYGSALDGHDVVTGFDGNIAGGQDLFDLDALFDALGVADGARAARVSLTDKGGTVEISVDTDGDSAFELLAATLATADAIAVGEDVVVGTL